MAVTENFGQMVVLSEGLSADGDTALFRYLHGTKPANLYIGGNLGGGSVRLMALSPSDEWVEMDAAIVKAGMYVISTNSFIGKCVLVGATTPDLDVYIQGSVVEYTE